MLCVVLCHFNLGLRGGYVGVDVFFVISGFLITRIIHAGLEAGSFSMVGFWERRVRRLVPALVVVTGAAALGGWFFLLPSSYADFGKSLASVWLMGANFHFWKDSGYFAAADADKPLLHTWSLAVEEQFYVVLPLLLVVLAQTGRLKRAPLLLGVLAAVTFFLAVRSVASRRQAAFYLLHFRAWELFAGALLALLARRLPAPRGLPAALLSLAGLAAILVPCFVYHHRTRFPGLAALPPVLGSVALIWAGAASGRLPLVNRWLAWPPLVAVGLWSYSIYLWHWPLWIALRAYTILPPEIWARLALAVGVVGLGYLSHRWIETPFRRRTLLPARGPLFASALAFAIVLLGAGMLVSQSGGFPGRAPAEIARIEETRRQSVRFRVGVRASDIPAAMRRFGAITAPADVLVWGDSHAMHWLPAIDDVARRHGVCVVVASHPGCAPVIFDGQPREQREFSEAVLRYLRTAPIRRVVLAARWARGVNDAGVPGALPEMVTTLRNLGCTVYVIADVPEFPFEVPWALSLARCWKRDPAVLGLTLEEHHRNNEHFQALVPELEKRGARVLDPVPVMQARGGSVRLQPWDAGGSLYFDKDHLSDYGSLALKDVVTPVFQDGPAVATPGSRRPPSPRPSGR